MNFQATAPLSILRFDHRVPFVKGLFGIAEGQAPDDRQRAQIVDLKTLVYEALIEMLDRDKSVDPQSVVAVLDEEYSAAIARAAKDAGIPVAISVERSGQNEFEFEYGDDFAQHIDAFTPEFVKALARYNPGGEHDLNSRQRDRLASLSSWATENGYPLVFELLIPATPEQLKLVDGDHLAFERELLVDLVMETISSFQAASIEAAVWMVPGFSATGACAQAATALRQGGRDDVRCVVLGQGPDADRVSEWIRIAGEAVGYDGLAVAQTIWLPTLTAYHSNAIDRATARTQIAGNFRSAIATFQAGAHQSGANQA